MSSYVRCSRCGMILSEEEIEPRSQMCWGCYAQDSIKVKDMLIEQLENQNDRLIAQRDTQKQQLAIYKRALELACVDILSEIGLYPFITFDYEVQFKKEYDNYLDQAKKELEE